MTIKQKIIFDTGPSSFSHKRNCTQNDHKCLVKQQALPTEVGPQTKLRRTPTSPQDENKYLQMEPTKSQTFNMKRFQQAVNALPRIITLDKDSIGKWAILDPGATSNFLMTNARALARSPAEGPLQVTLPDGNQVSFTHKRTLDIPGLPTKARLWHVIPGLASNSLVSVVILCNT